MNLENDLTEYAKEKLSEYKGFMTANNYEVLKVSDNYCELIGNVTESSVNHLGVAHGGFIFGLADTAGGIAAMTDGRGVVTINSSIDYLKTVKGSKIKAVAKCIKNGKRVSFYEVLIYDEEDSLVAKASINYIYI